MATQIFLEFSPRTLGKMNPFLTNIFQMGWFNHQLVFLLGGEAIGAFRSGNLLENWGEISAGFLSEERGLGGLDAFESLDFLMLDGCFAVCDDIVHLSFWYGWSWGMGANLVMNSPGDPVNGWFVHPTVGFHTKRGGENKYLIIYLHLLTFLRGIRGTPSQQMIFRTP